MRDRDDDDDGLAGLLKTVRQRAHAGVAAEGQKKIDEIAPEIRDRAQYMHYVVMSLVTSLGVPEELAAIVGGLCADETNEATAKGEQFLSNLLSASAHACRLRSVAGDGSWSELAARLSLEAERALHEEVKRARERSGEGT